MMSMLDDLADLFEQSAANGTPIRAVVGDDPVEPGVELLVHGLRGHGPSAGEDPDEE